MGTNITTSAVFGSLPTNRPDDLDDAYMDGGPYPLWPILQELANRSDFFQRAIYGLLVGGGKLTVTGAANTGVIGVTVGMIEAITLKDTAPNPDVWRVSSVPETSLNIGGTVLANDTWYNIFAKIQGGAVTYEVVDAATNPVNPSGVWKTGGADTHRFMGAFPTGPTGIPLPLRACHGRYRYLFSAIANNNIHRVLSVAGTSAIAWAPVSCAAVVPPWARVARLFVQFDPDVAGNILYLRTTGTSAFARAFPGPVSDVVAFETDIELNANQEFDYQVTAALDGVTIYVVGFE